MTARLLFFRGLPGIFNFFRFFVISQQKVTRKRREYAILDRRKFSLPLFPGREGDDINLLPLPILARKRRGRKEFPCRRRKGNSQIRKEEEKGICSRSSGGGGSGLNKPA